MGNLFSRAKTKKTTEPQTPPEKATAVEAVSPTASNVSTEGEQQDDLLSEELPLPRKRRQASINAADLTPEQRRNLFGQK